MSSATKYDQENDQSVFEDSSSLGQCREAALDDEGGADDDTTWVKKSSSPGSKKRGRGTEAYKAELAKDQEEKEEEGEEQEQDSVDHSTSTTLTEDAKSDSPKKQKVVRVSGDIIYSSEIEKFKRLSEIYHFDNKPAGTTFKTVNSRLTLSEERLKSIREKAEKKNKEPFYPQPEFVFDNVKLVLDCSQWTEGNKRGTKYGLFLVGKDGHPEVIEGINAIDSYGAVWFHKNKESVWPRGVEINTCEHPTFIYIKDKKAFEKLKELSKIENKTDEVLEEIKQFLKENKATAKLSIESDTFESEPNNLEVRDQNGKIRYQIKKKKVSTGVGKNKVDNWIPDPNFKAAHIRPEDQWTWNQVLGYLKQGAVLKIKLLYRGIGVEEGGKQKKASALHFGTVNVIQIKEFAPETEYCVEPWL